MEVEVVMGGAGVEIVSRARQDQTNRPMIGNQRRDREKEERGKT